MDPTEPRARTALLVRAIRVEVIDGPSRGASAEIEAEPLVIGTAEAASLRLTDTTVSRFHVELSPAAGGILVRDLGSTNGTRVGAVRMTEGIVPSGTCIQLGDTRIRVSEAGTTSIDPRAEVPGLVGRSAPARTLAHRVVRAAASDAPVLVTGESGTGKELVAAAVHSLSDRKAGPFIVVDCGSLAANLVESELFGHERGAFTGAREARAGALERARGGTVFIDEIGELAAGLQPMLLGALARGVVQRLGGEREIPIDVRVVAATHRDLRAAINAGTFRADLYHRIAVLCVAVPPLRARADDVPALVEHFLRSAGREGAREEIVPDEALARWCAHPWPGNVRELRNAVEAALALREPPDLEAPIATGPFAEILERPFREGRDEVMAGFERRYVEALLERARHNVAAAARAAGIERTYLHDLIKKHGLR